LHCLLIYYTCDVNICVEMDLGTHMVCARFYPLELGVTARRPDDRPSRGEIAPPFSSAG
jgi:hypothetical protein